MGNCVPRTEGIVSPSDQDMSQLASILFQAFLHTPLTVTERHSRDEIDRFSKDSEAIRGIETEAQEGTMDLKIRNDTPDAFQIRLNHENNHLNCSIFSSCDNGYRYRITNCNLAYIHDESGITEQVDVIQERYQKNHPNSACRKVLYRNSSRLLCDIPEGAIVLQRGSF
ncbi:MAG: hypothetical protein EOM64_06670 [Erysipelotrichia bacterium]|nr:hypothetical protein [Erysipelotrichia bacterium]